MKFGRAILSSDHRLSARLYGVLSMSAYMTSLLLILLLLLQLPLVYLDYSFPPWLLIYSIAGLGQPLLFLLGQQVLYHDWWRRLPHLPALLLTAIGLSVTISRAVLEAALVRDHTFVRTPKQGSEGLRARRAYRLPFDPAIVVEGALAMYAGTGLAIALARGNFGPSLFLLSCLLGFGYVALAGIAEQLA